MVMSESERKAKKAAADAIRYQKQKEERRLKRESRIPEEKEKVLQYKREYRQKNKEKINAYQRERWATKKEEKEGLQCYGL